MSPGSLMHAQFFMLAIVMMAPHDMLVRETGHPAPKRLILEHVFVNYAAARTHASYTVGAA